MEACIITLIYNNYNSLINTVNSVLQQEISYQYIIYDDGSSAVENAVINELRGLIKNRKNVSYIRSDVNQGTVKAFNSCLLKTSAEIIIPLSSGDIFFDKNSVREVIFAFQSRNVNLVTYDCFVYDEFPCNVASKKLPNKKDAEMLKLNSNKILKHLLQYGNSISGARTSYRRSFVEKLGYFDEEFRLLEDFPFYLNTLLNDFEISYLNKTIIYYKTGGVSTSGINPMLKADYYMILSKIENGSYHVPIDVAESYRIWLMFHFESKTQCFIMNPLKFIRLIYKKIIGKICRS